MEKGRAWEDSNFMTIFLCVFFRHPLPPPKKKIAGSVQGICTNKFSFYRCWFKRFLIWIFTTQSLKVDFVKFCGSMNTFTLTMNKLNMQLWSGSRSSIGCDNFFSTEPRYWRKRYVVIFLIVVYILTTIWRKITYSSLNPIQLSTIGIGQIRWFLM